MKLYVDPSIFCTLNAILLLLFHFTLITHFVYQLPDEGIIFQYEEPMVMATIITPDDYISEIMSLIMVNLNLSCKDKL